MSTTSVGLSAKVIGLCTYTNTGIIVEKGFFTHQFMHLPSFRDMYVFDVYSNITNSQLNGSMYNLIVLSKGVTTVGITVAAYHQPTLFIFFITAHVLYERFLTVLFLFREHVFHFLTCTCMHQRETTCHLGMQSKGNIQDCDLHSVLGDSLARKPIKLATTMQLYYICLVYTYITPKIAQ